MTPDSPSPPIAGTIKQAQKLIDGVFSGYIYDDINGRFKDGYPVNIIVVEDLGEGLYKTQSGNVYKIEGAENGR